MDTALPGPVQVWSHGDTSGHYVGLVLQERRGHSGQPARIQEQIIVGEQQYVAFRRLHAGVACCGDSADRLEDVAYRDREVL